MRTQEADKAPESNRTQRGLVGICRALAFAALGFVGKTALVRWTGWAIESDHVFRAASTGIALAFSAAIMVVAIVILAPLVLVLWNRFIADYLRMPRLTYSQSIVVVTFCHIIR